MLIVCPACASTYEIDADRLGPAGRSVRCAACRETWFIAPEPPAAAFADAGPSDPPEPAGEAAFAQAAEAPAPEPTPPKPRRGGRRGRAGRARRMTPALAAGLVLVAALPLLILGRATLVAALPQTATLFSGIGLPVNLRGIELRDVIAHRTVADGGAPGQLVVEGDLVGVGRGRVSVPSIEVEVRDARGQSLYRWRVAPPRASLELEEKARFRASLSAPPAEGRGVEVRFADDETPEPGVPAEPAH